MITIILPAKDIPENTIVRKPTGQQQFTVKHKLPLYGDKEQQIAVKVDEDFQGIFICSESGINIIDGEKMMAVDFEEISDAREFLEGL